MSNRTTGALGEQTEILSSTVGLDTRRTCSSTQTERVLLSLGEQVLGCSLDIQALDESRPPTAIPGFDGDRSALHDLDGNHVSDLRATFVEPKRVATARERSILGEIAGAVAANRATKAALGLIDPVTLLPNRRALLADLEKRPDGDNGLIVLITVADARQFNEILRALGHAYAEEFVATCAERIRATVDPQIRLYHISILSFVIIVPRPAGSAPPQVVHALSAAMQAPVNCRDIPITSRCGIGMSPVPPRPLSLTESLRAALTAAQDSRSRQMEYAFYDRRTDEAHQRAFTLLSDLRTAIESEDQLYLVYQPRISLQSGLAVGAEALLRWRHPVYGNVPPAEFIPLAEATALVTPLTAWVMNAAMRQTAIWNRKRLGLRTSVNVSPANLKEQHFAAQLAAGLDRYGISAEAIEIEITEGAATSGDSETLDQLNRIRALGHTLAVDDFGTGYSNLAHLGELPTSVLKIDQSFIRPLENDPRRQLMVRSVIEMAHGLGYSVVAEGIENGTAYDILADWNCDEGQGYHMSRPLAVPDFEAFIDR